MTAAVFLLLVSLFSDHVSCTVQGDVYRMHEADPVEWARADLCPGVRVKEDADTLILESPHIWVAVIIPPEYGHRRFMYRWGSAVAHVGPDTVPIVWGYVEKGS